MGRLKTHEERIAKRMLKKAAKRQAKKIAAAKPKGLIQKFAGLFSRGDKK